jgi:hypothetical protein
VIGGQNSKKERVKMDDLSRKIEKQIEESNKLIAEAKALVKQMRDVFKSVGADLDSGRNIFLERLSPEGRREAEGIIGKFDREFEDKYREYRNSLMPFQGGKRPASLKQALEEDWQHYREAMRKGKTKRVRRIRL